MITRTPYRGCNTAVRSVTKSSDFYAARGGIVDESNLDVFTDEPPPNDHPLFTLDNVVLTPHNASMTEKATVRMAVHAAQGIHEVLSGQMPTWPVNRPQRA
jgi:D-3-phosphoglycerate dehydrogenase / 2-oxoglutarate reductase